MRNKELEAIRYRDAHLEEVCAAKVSRIPFVPEQDYCPAWTSRDRKCPSGIPRLSRLGRLQVRMFRLGCDLEEQDRQQAKEVETPLRTLKILLIAFNFQTRKPPAKWPNGIKQKAFEIECEYANSKSLEDVELFGKSSVYSK